VGHDGARHLTPLFARRLVERAPGGTYKVNLDGEERDLLRNLGPQFAAMLDDPTQPVLERLFPPAYSAAGDLQLQEEYRRLMQEDLVERHRQELEVLASTAGGDTLTPEQLLAWAGALNSIRLVLGTHLDVQEEDEYRRAESFYETLYQWLTYVLGEVIEALEDQT
jgi:DNA-binding transcriptional MocR family regulator